MQIDRYNIEVFKDEGDISTLPVIYSYMMNGGGQRVWDKEKQSHPYILIAIDGGQWNHDLSPWEAERVFRREENFQGNADAYLEDLTERIIPAVEEPLGFTPQNRLIGGYSMSGLFSLYAVFKTGMFQGCASVSGSLWFDRFAQYCMEHRPDPAVRAVYLSLGDSEHRTRNMRMARVASCTQQIFERMIMLNLRSRFDLNPGGHMDNTDGRTAAAFRELIKLVV